MIKITRRQFGTKQKVADRNISQIFNPNNHFQRKQKEIKQMVGKIKY